MYNYDKIITSFRKTENVYAFISCTTQETVIRYAWENDRASIYTVAEKLKKIGFSNETTIEKDCWEKAGKIDLEQIFAVFPDPMTGDEVKSIFTKYYDQFAAIEERKKALAAFLNCDVKEIQQIENKIYACKGERYYVMTENERQDRTVVCIMRNLHRIPKDFTYQECYKFQNLRYESEIMSWIEQSKHDFVLGMLFQSFNQNDWEIFFSHVIEKFGRAIFLGAEEPEAEIDRYFVCKIKTDKQ